MPLDINIEEQYLSNVWVYVEYMFEYIVIGNFLTYPNQDDLNKQQLSEWFKMASIQSAVSCVNWVMIIFDDN